MQATCRPVVLQPGQSLAPDRQASGRLLVAEGEVLVQAPAQWLCETVVFALPRRVAAPAALACRDIASLTAIGAAKVHLEEAASPIERLRAAWSRWRPMRAGKALVPAAYWLQWTGRFRLRNTACSSSMRR